MNLHQKLADVMQEVGYVQKDAVNEFHRYRYASAEAVLRKVNAALAKRGIAVSSQAELLHYADNHAVVRLSLAFLDGDESVTAQGLGEGSDKGDKAVMKANTAALKYALANAFMISWGDDPEGDAETDKAAAERAKPIPEDNPLGEEELPSYPHVTLPDLSRRSPRTNAMKAILGHAQVQGWSEEQFLAWLAERFPGKEFRELTTSQTQSLLDEIKGAKVG